MPIVIRRPLGGAPRISVIERARRYIAKIPGAVSGQGGHAQTFHVACILVHGFGLSEADAFALLSEWSKTCLPPWNDAELRHKIQSASNASPIHPRGWLAGAGFSNYASNPRIIATTPSERLRKLAAASLPHILEKFQCNQDDFRNSSPIPVIGVEEKDQWRLFLQTMFEPDEVIWIGQVADTGRPCHADHFRTQRQWLESDTQPGNFICPSTFKAGSFRRTKENRKASPFLILESDKLEENEQFALIKWHQQFSPLRAITYSGGKSYHAWFERPSPDVLEALRTICPDLNLDPASSRDVQPVRLPGVFRQDKQRWQTLVYLSPTKGSL